MPLKIPTVQVGLEESIQKAMRSAGRNAQINLGTNTRQINALKQPLGRITGQADEFTKSMEAANARVFAFGASVGIINSVSNAFGALVKNTIEVEKSLTEINSVLNASSEDLTNFGNALFDVARNTGQTFDTVAKGALELARQGLSTEETLKRINDALILSRLSGIDAAQSVEGLTAAFNSFKEDGVTVSEILNKLVIVSQKFAVSEKDLIEGLKRSASVADQAGVSLDELIAIITAVQERTSRGGAVIGNAFKTIFARIQDKGALKDLQDFGIQVTDIAGNILPATTILQNLSKEFENLSQADQADLAKKLGGVYQLSNLLAALKDLSSEQSKYSQALKFSTLASDEAYKKNEILNQTLSSLLNKVTVSAQQLGATLGEIGLTDSAKYLLGFFNNLLQSIQNVLGEESAMGDFLKGMVKGFGNLLTGPGLALFAAIIAKLSKDLVQFGFSSLKSFFGIGKAAKEIQTVEKAIASALSSNINLQRQLFALEGDRAAQIKLMTSAIIDQESAIRRIANISGSLATPLYGAGIRSTSEGLRVPPPKQRAASGYVPEVRQEESDIKKGVGGARPGDKPVVIPNFSFGNGRKGSIVAHTGEYMVPNYKGGDGTAIFNRDMVQSMGMPNGAIKINASGGFVPNFAKTIRKVGYLDGDVLDDPENRAIVEAQMKKLGISKVGDYHKYLGDLVSSARASGALKKFTGIFGVPGSGKSTMMLGGGRGAIADAASARTTKRIPILKPEDISKVSEIVDTRASTKGTLDAIQGGYLSNVDRLMILSTSTREEQKEAARRRVYRIENKSSTLFGREGSASLAANLDSGPVEAAAINTLGKKVSVYGLRENFKLKRKTGEELPEIKRAKVGLMYGAFAPATIGHRKMFEEALARGIPEENIVAAISREGGRIDPSDPHSFRTAIFNQQMRMAGARRAFGNANITKASMDLFGGSVPNVLEITKKEDTRRKFLIAQQGSLAFVGSDKTEKDLDKYRRYYNPIVLDRSDGISGTQAREAILSGDTATMEKVFTKESFDFWQSNKDVIKDRAAAIPKILARVSKQIDEQMIPIEKELSKYPARMTQKWKDENPGLPEKVLEIRANRDKLKKKLQTLPTKYLSILAKLFPQKYAIKGMAEGFVPNYALSDKKIEALKSLLRKGSGAFPQEKAFAKSALLKDFREKRKLGKTEGVKNAISLQELFSRDAYYDEKLGLGGKWSSFLDSFYSKSTGTSSEVFKDVLSFFNSTTDGKETLNSLRKHVKSKGFVPNFAQTATDYIRTIARNIYGRELDEEGVPISQKSSLKETANLSKTSNAFRKLTEIPEESLTIPQRNLRQRIYQDYSKISGISTKTPSLSPSLKTQATKKNQTKSGFEFDQNESRVLVNPSNYAFMIPSQGSIKGTFDRGSVRIDNISTAFKLNPSIKPLTPRIGESDKVAEPYNSQLEERIMDMIALSSSQYAETLRLGKPIGANFKQDIRKRLESQEGARGAVQSAVGVGFEAAIRNALKLEEGSSNSSGKGNFDFRAGVSGNKTADVELRELFRIPKNINLGDFKSSSSKGNIESFVGKILREENYNPKLAKEELENLSKAPIGKAKASKGFIPNFADPLKDAIDREVSAGIPKSQIYIDKNPILKTQENPLGLMVANKKDEPMGGIQGIQRAIKEGRDPKKYGAAKGFIPNFAAPDAPTLSSVKLGVEIPAGFQQAFEALLKSVNSSNSSLKDFENNLEKYVGSLTIGADAQKKLFDGSIDLAQQYQKQIALEKSEIEERKARRQKTAAQLEQYYATSVLATKGNEKLAKQVDAVLKEFNKSPKSAQDLQNAQKKLTDIYTKNASIDQRKVGRLTSENTVSYLAENRTTAQAPDQAQKGQRDILGSIFALQSAFSVLSGYTEDLTGGFGAVLKGLNSFASGVTTAAFAYEGINSLSKKMSESGSKLTSSLGGIVGKFGAFGAGAMVLFEGFKAGKAILNEFSGANALAAKNTARLASAAQEAAIKLEEYDPVQQNKINQQAKDILYNFENRRTTVEGTFAKRGEETIKGKISLSSDEEKDNLTKAVAMAIASGVSPEEISQRIYLFSKTDLRDTNSTEAVINKDSVSDVIESLVDLGKESNLPEIRKEIQDYILKGVTPTYPSLPKVQTEQMFYKEGGKEQLERFLGGFSETSIDNTIKLVEKLLKQKKTEYEEETQKISQDLLKLIQEINVESIFRNKNLQQSDLLSRKEYENAKKIASVNSEMFLSEEAKTRQLLLQEKSHGRIMADLKAQKDIQSEIESTVRAISSSTTRPSSMDESSYAKIISEAVETYSTSDWQKTVSDLIRSGKGEEAKKTVQETVTSLLPEGLKQNSPLIAEVTAKLLELSKRQLSINDSVEQETKWREKNIDLQIESIGLEKQRERILKSIETAANTRISFEELKSVKAQGATVGMDSRKQIELLNLERYSGITDPRELLKRQQEIEEKYFQLNLKADTEKQLRELKIEIQRELYTRENIAALYENTTSINDLQEEISKLPDTLLEFYKTPNPISQVSDFSSILGPDFLQFQKHDPFLGSTTKGFNKYSVGDIPESTSFQLRRLIAAEVGSQSDDAKAGFLATVLNRAKLTGSPVSKIITSERYYQPLKNQNKFNQVQPITKDHLARLFNNPNIDLPYFHNVTGGGNKEGKNLLRQANVDPADIGKRSNIGKEIDGEIYYSKPGESKRFNSSAQLQWGEVKGIIGDQNLDILEKYAEQIFKVSETLSKVEDQKILIEEADRQALKIAGGNLDLQQRISALIQKAATDRALISATAKNSQKERDWAKLLKDAENAPLLFESGMQESLTGMKKQINDFGNTLGKEIPQLFSDGLSNAIMNAIDGTESLKDSLRSAAYEFLKAINQRVISNFADKVTTSLFESKGTGGALSSLFKGFVGFSSGGNVKGGSGYKDDVPSMLTGGEYVINKKAAQKYGVQFLDALNSGNLKGFASGGYVKKDYFVPGENNQGEIEGRENLLNFARQGYTSGQQDRIISGENFASISLEPESMRLTNLGRRFGPQAERTRSVKEQAIGLYLQDYQAEQERKKAEKEQKEALKKNLLLMAATSIISAGVNSGIKGFTSTKKLKGIWSGDQYGVGGVKNFITSPLKMFSGDFSGAFNKFKLSQGIIPRAHELTEKELQELYTIKRATGGIIPNASGVDTVPAMLSGGEFIMNRNAVSNIGSGTLNSLNSGSSSIATEETSERLNDRIIEKLDELINSMSSASGAITINVEGSTGAATESVQGQTSDQRHQLARHIKDVVLKVIEEEKRIGGQLRRGL